MEYKGIVKQGDKVLLISSLQAQREEVLKVHTNITNCIGEEGTLDLEQIERLSSVQLSISSYDSIILPKFNTYLFNVGTQQLGQLLQGLKPNGRLHYYLNEVDQTSLISILKVSGFTDVKSSSDKITALKPEYEVGASQTLKLNRNKDKPKVNLWDDDDDEDLIDDNILINDKDFIKPDLADLSRPEGSVVRKKACKNCSCGLAEIEAEEELQKLEINGSGTTKVKAIVLDTKDVKSSCGSCYLGDAFRCASCPYLGLPAFNPGEKVTLNSSMLNDDIEL